MILENKNTKHNHGEHRDSFTHWPLRPHCENTVLMQIFMMVTDMITS